MDEACLSKMALCVNKHYRTLASLYWYSYCLLFIVYCLLLVACCLVESQSLRENCTAELQQHQNFGPSGVRMTLPPTLQYDVYLKTKKLQVEIFGRQNCLYI